MPLDINDSGWKFSIEEGKLRIGFVAVKGLGEVAYIELDSHRPYNCLQDVIDNVNGKFNKTSFTTAIFGGAFDSINDNRLDIYNEYATIKKFDVPEIIKISKDKSFRYDACLDEIETAIFEISLISNPVQYFDHFSLYDMKDNEIANIQAIVRKVKKIKDKNKNNMAFLTLETSCGYIEGVVFKDAYKGNTKYMKNNLIINLEIKKANNGAIIQKFIA